MKSISFHLPAASGCDCDGPDVDEGQFGVRHVAAFDFIADHFAVTDFSIRRTSLTAPEPGWLGAVHEGRVLDLPTARRLFTHMIEGGGVHTGFVAEVGVEISLSFDYFVPLDFDGDEDEVPIGPADQDFWHRLRDRLPPPGTALVVVRRAHGPSGQRWYRVRELVRSTMDEPREIVVHPVEAGVELRTVFVPSDSFADDDLPDGDDLAFFPDPDRCADEVLAGDHPLEGVVPDVDGVVRAPRIP